MQITVSNSWDSWETFRKKILQKRLFLKVFVKQNLFQMCLVFSYGYEKQSRWLNNKAAKQNTAILPCLGTSIKTKIILPSSSTWYINKIFHKARTARQEEKSVRILQPHIPSSDGEKDKDCKSSLSFSVALLLGIKATFFVVNFLTFSRLCLVYRSSASVVSFFCKSCGDKLNNFTHLFDQWLASFSKNGICTM